MEIFLISTQIQCMGIPEIQLINCMYSKSKHMHGDVYLVYITGNMKYKCNIASRPQKV